jgi:plastocyanin
LAGVAVLPHRPGLPRLIVDEDGGEMRRLVSTAVVALLVASCGADSDGGGRGAPAFDPLAGGVERTVLVDYRHDEFASAFLRYYPETVRVRPGDVVSFRQSWTGEPHSVTMGRVVDDIFEYGGLLAEFESEAEALAGGVPPETIEKVNDTFSRFPAMVGDARETFAPGAQPCFVPRLDAVPFFSESGNDGGHIAGVQCPTLGQPQPRFDGQQGLYNSGFIAPDGAGANRFQVPIAADAEPGTYRYFCNYHWTDMGGTIEIVDKRSEIPSQKEVSRQARKEIDADADRVRSTVERARAARVGAVVDGHRLPLAGAVDDDFTVVANEFLPRTIEAKLGDPVTWTIDGIDHTISFNVPKYFPIFTIRRTGEVTWEPDSFEPVGWEVDAAPLADESKEDVNRDVDVGSWDGEGGFHSSGALAAGDTFTVAFSKAGTYPYACVLHPQMVGVVEVD